MITKVLIFFILILGFTSKAQNWTPLDTGLHYSISVNYPYGLMADDKNDNLYAFGTHYGSSYFPTPTGVTVWKNNKWQLWHQNINWYSNSYDVAYFNNKPLIFYHYNESNDLSKPRTALLQFTNSTDLDTIKILKNQAWFPSINCVYNGKLILFSTSNYPSGIGSIATFDGDTVITIGNPLIAHAGFVSACVYKGELYTAGGLDIDNHLWGVQKLTPTGWQTIYEIKGSMSFIQDMIVYNNRLYIFGGISKAESLDNLGDGIIAYDGVKFDSLQGGVINPNNLTNGNVYDASVCNGKLYITGNFYEAGGIKARGIAYWNDTTWCNVYKDLDSTFNFYRLECFHDTIYEVAEFYKINNNYKYGMVAKLSNMSLADTCTQPRYPKPTHYNFENLSVYPNPFTNEIRLQIPNSFILLETKITITNNLGQILLNFYPTSINELINLSSLVKGMYYLNIQDNSISKTVKIIKQ